MADIPNKVSDAGRTHRIYDGSDGRVRKRSGRDGGGEGLRGLHVNELNKRSHDVRSLNELGQFVNI